MTTSSSSSTQNKATSQRSVPFRPPLLPFPAANNAPPPQRHREVMSRLLGRSESPTLKLSKRMESQMLTRGEAVPIKRRAGEVSSSSPSSRSILPNSECPTLNLSKRSESRMLTCGEAVTCSQNRSVSMMKRRVGEVTSSSSTNSESPTLNLSKRGESALLTCREVITPMPSRSTSTIKSRNIDISDAERLLMTSTRSLSVSFQGENKAKVKPSPSARSSSLSRVRKGTEERPKLTPVVKHQAENDIICDRDRWNGGSKRINSRSLDYGNDKSKLFQSSSRIRGLQNYVISNSESKRETRLKNDVICRAECVDEVKSVSIPVESDGSLVSDSDTASSGQSGSTIGGSVVKLQGGRGGIVVPSRFLQDGNSRRRMEVEMTFGTPNSKKNNFKIMSTSTPISTKKYLQERVISKSKVESVDERFTSPIRGASNRASISKGLFTLMKCSSPRGRPSPTRTRNETPKYSNDNAATSILSFNADIRRVGGGEKRVDDAHEFRMLHNRQLQWRFINGRTEAALLAQSGTAERNLYNAWVTISKLQDSIRSKRIQLQLLRQNLKLCSILKGQVPYLESWSLIDQDHCISLSEAREALRTCIANLPLVNGARADIQLLKNTICSAADVMQGVTSTIGSHLIMVEQITLLTSELANTAAHEIALIEQGKTLLSDLATSQVNNCCLKAHQLQLLHDASSSQVTQV